jgi:hypothetical protein
MKHLIYSLATGEILRMVYCDSSMIEAQCEVGVTAYIGGDGDDSTQYVSAGYLVNKPVCPSENHTFNWDTKQWQDPRTLQDFRDAKWAVIKAARNAAEFGTFIYNGMVLDGDVDAQRRLAGYISVSKSALASGTPFQAEFTLANNTLVVLTAEDFVGIEIAKMMSVAEAFSHAVALRASIDEATTQDAVDIVSW